MENISQQYDAKTEPDMLQLNMETISKELNELIVMSEQEFGVVAQSPQAAANNLPNTVHLQTPQTTFPQTNFQESIYLTNNMYGNHQQLQFIDRFQNMKSSSTFLDNVPLTQLFFDFNSGKRYNPAMACYLPANYLYGNSNVNISSSNGSSTATPTYEFHYLKSSGEHGRKSLRYNNAADNSTYRKTPKLINKYVNQKYQTSTLNSENIKIDLLKIDLFKDG